MCFIYEIYQSDSKLYVQKIWGMGFIIIFENWTRGTNHLKGA